VNEGGRPRAGAMPRSGPESPSLSADFSGSDAAGESPRKGLLSPADQVAIVYFIIISILAAISRERIGSWVQFIAAHALVVAMIVLIARWAVWADGSSAGAVASSPGVPVRARRLALLAHGWYPVALLPLSYKELTYLIPRIHARDFDGALAAIDYRVFGAHPTVWLERLTWPPLTELLQLCYPTYYVLPIILGAVIWRSGNRERYRFWVFVVTFGFYISYLGYIAVPAIGPRFLSEIVGAQTKPLTGVFLFQVVREALDRAEGLTRDCFPSGHTEMTLLTLYYARRFHHKTFWFFLPLGTAIILSTVYLRYHYVIDVAAGVVLAFLIVVVAERVYRVLTCSGIATLAQG
jgi:membrane-associated phospholipid phosphatase